MTELTVNTLQKSDGRTLKNAISKYIFIFLNSQNDDGDDCQRSIYGFVQLTFDIKLFFCQLMSIVGTCVCVCLCVCV